MAVYFSLMAFKIGCQPNEAGFSLYPSLGAMTIAYKLAFESCEPLQLKPQINTGKTNLLVQDSIISYECPSTCNILFFRTSGFYWERLNLAIKYLKNSQPHS
ncbi:hypothetical protein QWZ13_14385 [Reinekea marina]|uniref:hypothetical protein n=1 Tax=Reinekea marina TaxID=1310421 RepID=UPI0025B5E4DC|nr:hypothetical protein [Reinekea marina]MDN3650104.1 hypothetical protein [Reinekea marina]